MNISNSVPIIILMRHGASLPNKESRLYGQIDVALDPEGYNKIIQGAELIWDSFHKTIRTRGFATFMSSDLTRCRETALIVRKVIEGHLRGLLPLILTPDLREIYLGTWENARLEEVIEEVMPFFDHFDSAPDLAINGLTGESNLMVKKRVLPILKRFNLYNIQKQNKHFNKHLASLERIVLFNKWIEEATKYSGKFQLHLFILHEGSAYALLNLLGINPWEQDARKEFFGFHQNCFCRGDVWFLRPVFKYENSIHLSKAVGWKVIPGNSEIMGG